MEIDKHIHINKNLSLLNKSSNLETTTTIENLLNMQSINFKNEDYILKHNMNSNLKFFKDELTIKFIGKGNNNIDYAVKKFNKIK
jgi:hypothetical protein